MTDKAIDAAEYYNQHAAEEREYVRVYCALPAKEGDHWVASLGGLNIQQSADEAGYILKAYTGMQNHSEEFLTADEFKNNTADASKLATSLPRSDVSEDDAKALTPVKKGKRIVVNVGLPLATTADCDGFLYKTDSGNVFLSNYSVSAAFNYAGQKAQSHEEFVVTKKDEPAIKGIILNEDVTFNFKSGPYEAKKGAFLSPNAQDEDGYTAYPPGFAAFGLRQNQEEQPKPAAAAPKQSAPSA